MLYLHCFVMCWLFQAISLNVIDELEPGQCLSKFDYDFKVMQTLLKLEQEVVAMREKIQTVEQSIGGLGIAEKDDHLIAFEAQLSASMVNPVKNTVVVFDDVLTNIGNDYKPQSGVFIATKPGVYNFNLVATSTAKSKGQHLHLYMMHNEDKIGYIFLDGNTGYSLIRSTNAIITLKPGDTVFVKIGNVGTTVTLNGGNFHTHFSGFRISKA